MVLYLIRSPVTMQMISMPITLNVCLHLVVITLNIYIYTNVLIINELLCCSMARSIEQLWIIVPIVVAGLPRRLAISSVDIIIIIIVMSSNQLSIQWLHNHDIAGCCDDGSSGAVFCLLRPLQRLDLRGRQCTRVTGEHRRKCCRVRQVHLIFV